MWKNCLRVAQPKYFKGQAIAWYSSQRWSANRPIHDTLVSPWRRQSTSTSMQRSRQLPKRTVAPISPSTDGQSGNETKSSGQLIPVSALHIAQTIHLAPSLNSMKHLHPVKHKWFGKNSFVAELSPVRNRPRYVAVYRFGSVVAFNVSPDDLSQWIEVIRRKKNCTNPARIGNERKENFGIMIQDVSEYASIVDDGAQVVTGDYCIVPVLDMNGVAVISTIMAQTVALDKYNDTVDNLLATFAGINANVSKTGTFTQAEKDYLFRTVAQNNSIFIDMISRVRLKDRSDTAWNLVKYENIHYGMKDEFEIDDRFDQIDFKLNLIQQNAKFFLDMLQHQKSNSLEWTIVVLILLECVLMCVEMSGMGEPLFRRISEIIYGS